MRRMRTKVEAAPRFDRLEVRSLLSTVVPDTIAPALAVDAGAFDPTRVLVRYRAGAERAFGAAAGRALEVVPGLRAVPIDGDVAEALASFRADPDVLYAEPDYVVRVARTPDDPAFNQLYGLNNTGQGGGTADADIDAPEAWDVTTGAGGTVVAVIDTGIDYNHPDLVGNIWTNAGEVAGNGLDDDGNGFVDDVHGYDFANNDANPMDDHGHGTHVAGTIGATGNNGFGVAGVAWNDVRLMALKFLGADGSGSLSGALAAIGYAVANGATVSNNSWGGGDYSQALRDAIADAAAEDHVFVAAAGNNGSDNDLTPFYPAGYDVANIVSVAATDRNDARASFSNFGAGSVDVGAPGAEILSTLPGNRYGTSSGTSMASPHVAGVVALVRGQHPDWTAGQVIGRVLSTADPVASLAHRTVTGGRVNVGRAVTPPAPAPTSHRFDFEPTAAPTATGYVGVGSATAYEPGRGFGWTAGVVNVADRRSGSDLDRDFAYTGDATFVVDVVDGAYDVTVRLGDAAGAGRDFMAVELEGTRVETVSTAANQVVDRTYAVTVTDGQLTLRLRDLGGADFNALITGLDVVPAAGPRVVSSVPAGAVFGAVDSVRLTFSGPIDAASFTTADVASFNGPNGAIAATGVAEVAGSDGTQFDVRFVPQSAAGSYSMVIGPGVLDRDGDPMDQDGDGLGGESPDDRYTATFTISPPPPPARRFDFGPNGAPVADGYVGVGAASAYDPTLGYGWTAGVVHDHDRRAGSDLDRDFAYTADATFVVDVANGSYDVTVRLGDAAGAARDLMAVELEGVRVETVSTAANQVVSRTYTVDVSDGRLTLRLRDLGGADFNALITALDVVSVGGAGATGLDARAVDALFALGEVPAFDPVLSGSRAIRRDAGPAIRLA